MCERDFKAAPDPQEALDLPPDAIKQLPAVDFDLLRHRMRYAPFVLIMKVPEWRTFISPIQQVSLN